MLMKRRARLQQQAQEAEERLRRRNYELAARQARTEIQHQKKAAQKRQREIERASREEKFKPQEIAAKARKSEKESLRLVKAKPAADIRRREQEQRVWAMKFGRDLAVKTRQMSRGGGIADVTGAKRRLLKVSSFQFAARLVRELVDCTVIGNKE